MSSGLDFPGTSASTVRFKFTDPHMNGLPIYGPSGAGATYLWRVYPRQKSGYYTTFFWGNDDGVGTIEHTFQWHDGNCDTFYGCHPYPYPGEHRWEIAVEGVDEVNGTVVWDAWYQQMFRTWAAGDGKHHEFYWNLPSVAAGNRVSHLASTGYGETNPPSPALTIGDAPWNPTQEILDGVLRGIQIYSVLLTEAQGITLCALETDAAVLAKCTDLGLSAPWYLNMNPTPTDITDKSGNGRNPAWVGSGRPTLWADSPIGIVSLRAS